MSADRELWAGPRGDGVRRDHLTFLVLAGAVVLVAFALGVVPALLLPPALHSADRNRPRDRRSEAAAARRGTIWTLPACWRRRSARESGNSGAPATPMVTGSPWGGT